MSALISLTNVSLAYGLEPLLENVSLQINSGERVCVIGRNGTGKSTLLKVIDGSVIADKANIWRKPALKIARLAQELPEGKDLTIYEFVAEGLADTGALLTQHHQLAHLIATDTDPKLLKKLQHIQDQLEAKNGWHFDQEIQTILTRLSLDPDMKVAALSGGWQRRAALAQSLVTHPDVLLLDEPTNHLDIEAIQWLEEFLLSSNITLVFITHDRALLQRLATRIIELDRGNLTSWDCNYQSFLERKEAMLLAEDKHHADFDKRLAQEEKWIRQGIKARRTRNEGRVRALKAMRVERSKRRLQQGNVKLTLNAADNSGQLVIEATNISQSYHGKYVIKNFSTTIMRGDRIGLLGPNGIGKSTLLNILLGKLIPEEGSVRHGTNLQIAYFDQQRAALDLNKTVAENVSHGSDTIQIGTERKHIISYLNDFLFTPQRALTPVKALSGGECNRLLLARLFSLPSNVLVMDEPTNDLDIETLELLEELLSQYKGTLLIVSHDRNFLDNVVTSTMVFEGNGKIQEYTGGYQDWLSQKSNPQTTLNKTETKITTPPLTKDNKKLSYKEQQELSKLPQKIEELEKQQTDLQASMAETSFYQQSADIIAKETTRLGQLAQELEVAYARWNELDKKVK